MAGARRGAAEIVAGAAVLLVTAGFMAYAALNTGRSVGSGTRLQARFENVGSLGSGTDVRIGGVKVGSVTGTAIDPQTFQAVVSFTVQSNLKLPTDTSATISTGGLLGGAFMSLTPGGADAILSDNGTVTITQSASNLEDLLGKFIFNVGSLAEATQKSLKERQGGASQ